MILSLLSTPPGPAESLAYLRERLGVRDLALGSEFTPTTDGWETYIFRFRLESNEPLPPGFRGPIVLRMYASAHGAPRLRREFAVQRHMLRLGYRVAEPLLMEAAPHRLGGPFMIMRELRGRPLLELMLHHPWRLIDGPGLLAEAHARLHRLPTDGCPAPAGDLLERSFVELDGLIQDYDLPGLRSGLDWLRAHQPPRGSPCILHLDFHPGNLLYESGEVTGVVDWAETDVGDYHADVATTLILMRTVPIEVPRLWQRIGMGPARGVLYRRYLRAYRRLQPVDPAKLSYYLAWAAFRRLCRYGTWLRTGPWIIGSKPSCMRFLRRNWLALLVRCFEEQTRTRVRVDT